MLGPCWLGSGRQWFLWKHCQPAWPCGWWEGSFACCGWYWCPQLSCCSQRTWTPTHGQKHPLRITVLYRQQFGKKASLISTNKNFIFLKICQNGLAFLPDIHIHWRGCCSPGRFCWPAHPRHSHGFGGGSSWSNWNTSHLHRHKPPILLSLFLQLSNLLCHDLFSRSPVSPWHRIKIFIIQISSRQRILFHRNDFLVNLNAKWLLRPLNWWNNCFRFIQWSTFFAKTFLHMLQLPPLILHDLILSAFGISHSLTKILRTLYIQPPNLHALLHTPWTYRSSAKLIFSQINPPAPELILDAIENPHYLLKLLYLSLLLHELLQQRFHTP